VNQKGSCLFLKCNNFANLEGKQSRFTYQSQSQLCDSILFTFNHKNNYFLGSSFIPKPDVDVGVVRLVPKAVPDVSVPFDVFEKVTRTIFLMRQKFCKNPLE